MGTHAGTESGGGFRARAVAQIEGVPEQQRWLVESLWAAEGVGIVGGTPKTGKTWASLEVAIAVASGKPAWGKFEVPTPGPVLVYPAEDNAAAMRDRIEMLCKRKGLELEGLPLFLLEADQVHLDDEGDRAKLEEVLTKTRPRLIVLDPLVRLHKGSESNAQHIAELLGYLRSVQRRFQLAVMITHHLAKQKSKAAGIQPGQALRGSGDLHAWGDSNLYLSKLEQGVVSMTVEHRQAPTPEEPLYYKLAIGGGEACLELLDELPEVELAPEAPRARNSSAARVALPARPLEERILELLDGRGPRSQVAIRKQLRVRNQKLTEALRDLVVADQVVREGRTWARTSEEAAEDGLPALGLHEE